eukprot:m.141262 g.141262  ORF g.141262 m.141262 type:complete len:489 (-) comp30172_c0_seq1:131-1597(-)
MAPASTSSRTEQGDTDILLPASGAETDTEKTPPPVDESNYAPYPLFYIGLLTFCCVVSYTMRWNVTIAINGDDGMAAKFNWNNEEKGEVLGSFFYGYVILQVPGGLVASRFGGKIVLVVAMFGTCLTTAMVPWVVTKNTLALRILRITCGLFQSSVYPAWAACVAHHVPLHRRNLAAGAFSAGASLGIVVMWLVGPVLQNTFGWEWNFYGPAAAGALWLLLWLVAAPSLKLPLKKGRKQDDQVLLLSSDTAVGKKQSNFEIARLWLYVMLTDPAMWGVYISAFAQGWVFYSLLSFLPQWMHQIYGLNLQGSAAVSVIPYAVRCIVTLGSGQIADRLTRKGIRVITTRKIFAFLSLLTPAIALFVCAVATPKSQEIAIVLLAVGVGMSGLCDVSNMYGPIEMFPHTAGGSYGMANFFANVAGFITPPIMGSLLDAGGCPSGSTNTTHIGDDCKRAWALSFYVTVGVSAVGILAYLSLGHMHAVYRKTIE